MSAIHYQLLDPERSSPILKLRGDTIQSAEKGVEIQSTKNRNIPRNEEKTSKLTPNYSVAITFLTKIWIAYKLVFQEIFVLTEGSDQTVRPLRVDEWTRWTGLTDEDEHTDIPETVLSREYIRDILITYGTSEAWILF